MRTKKDPEALQLGDVIRMIEGRTHTARIKGDPHVWRIAEVDSSRAKPIRLYCAGLTTRWVRLRDLTFEPFTDHDGLLTTTIRARPLYYLLGGEDGHTPIPCESSLLWGVWFERSCQQFKEGIKPDRQVAEDQVGEARVSTVFLGLDHNYGDGAPILFETMIFGGEHDEFQERYHTWEEAVIRHEWIVKALTEGLSPLEGLEEDIHAKDEE